MGKIRGILGDNIRKLRNSKGWTQVYLADCLQITPPFLAQIESGKRGTSLDLVENIAELFGVPIASLFLEQMPIQSEIKSNIKQIEIQTIKKQLSESIQLALTEAFEKIKSEN